MWKSIKFISYKYSLHQRTPLHIAAKENYERTAECIIDQGADTNIKDNDGVRECTVRTTGGRLQNCYILEIHFVNEACCYPLSQAFCRNVFFFLGRNLQKQEEETLVCFIMWMKSVSTYIVRRPGNEATMLHRWTISCHLCCAVLHVRHLYFTSEALNLSDASKYRRIGLLGACA